MARSSAMAPKQVGRRWAGPAVVRVRYVSDPGGETPIYRFVDPRPAAAIGAAADVGQPAEAADELQVLVSAEPRRPTDPWVEPIGPDDPRPVDVAIDGGRLLWRAGRAIVAGAPSVDDVLTGLVDFAFYEAELRAIEAALPPLEAAAAEDVRLAYRINDRDRAEWSRLGQTTESLARLRLTFARLEPRLGRPSRAMPAAGRQAFRRLVARADVEDRLASVSDRLEACEDLYEGAVDRITDHRWWRKGHQLEAVIVVLLAIEGLQLAAELVLRLRGGR